MPNAARSAPNTPLSRTVASADVEESSCRRKPCSTISPRLTSNHVVADIEEMQHTIRSIWTDPRRLFYESIEEQVCIGYNHELGSASYARMPLMPGVVMLEGAAPDQRLLRTSTTAWA